MNASFSSHAQHKSQTGSALVITLVIILVVAITGGLGYAYVQKSQETTPATSQPGTTDEQASVTAEQLDKTYVMPGENVSISYPNGWELITKTETNNGLTDNRALLIRPDNFALEFAIPSYGPAWPFGERPFSCPFDKEYVASDTAEQTCPTYTQLPTDTSSNLAGVSVIGLGVTYPESATLQNHQTLLLAKDGCTALESSLCSRPDATTGYYLVAEGSYYTELSATDRADVGLYNGVTYKQMTNKEFTQSKDVKTAIAILASAKKEGTN